MKEEDKELFGLWKSSDEKEKKMRSDLTLHSLDHYQKKSNDIFGRIRRNMLIELVASAVAAVALPYAFRNAHYFGWLVLLMAVAVLLTVYIYGGYFKEIRDLNAGSIRESLERKHSILKRYIRRLYIINYTLVPVAAFAGVLMKTGPELFEQTEPLLVILGILAVLSVIMMFLIRLYINALYGKHYKRVTKLLEEMNASSEED